MDKLVSGIFERCANILNRFSVESKDTVINIAKSVSNTFLSGRKVLVMGNGGSAADAQHIAAEFVNRYSIERPPLPVIALTADPAILTAISNDSSFDDIFLKQIMAFANPSDLVWAISTSGNTTNILKSLQYCSKNSIKTIGFTGPDNSKMSGVCDIVLNVPSKDTPRIQEIHILAAHIICELVDEMLFGKFSMKIDE
jgi:D-sedoheptulose 7-phosphate isomerase